MKTESFNAWIDLTGKEIDRKYFYPNGQIIEAKSVKAVQIQPNGTHVVKLTNELEVNVEAGWVAFSFTSPNNDFAFNIANHNQDTLSTWNMFYKAKKIPEFIHLMDLNILLKILSKYSLKNQVHIK